MYSYSHIACGFVKGVILPDIVFHSWMAHLIYELSMHKCSIREFVSYSWMACPIREFVTLFVDGHPILQTSL